MSSWRVETSSEFDRSLRRLDHAAAVRVVNYLRALLELDDPRQRGRGLSANRAGFWRYRVGDYRILAEIRDDRLVVIALDVAHRSTAYDA